MDKIVFHSQMSAPHRSILSIVKGCPLIGGSIEGRSDGCLAAECVDLVMEVMEYHVI